ncbi:MAG: magnesium transporter [Acidimicrobiia bacterium]
MLAVSVGTGLVATTLAVVIVSYGAVATDRLGLDPDSHGIPIVTSSLDLLGALSLILMLVALGLN